MKNGIVIVGGVAAGMSAAAKAARVNPGIPVTVFTDEEYVSYGACGFPYYLSGEIPDENRLVARTVEQFRDQGVEVKTGHEVIEIKPNQKTVLVRDLKRGALLEQSYDRLVIATGAVPFVPPVEGVELENVFVLRNMKHGIVLKSSIAARNYRKAVIVGGGYIGLEMAETFIKLGCKVSIIELAPQIIPNMDSDMAEIMKDYLLANGVDIFTGEKLTRIEGTGEVKKVVTDKRDIPADCVLLAVGTLPNTNLASRAGIELGVKKAIRVNTRMETSVPGIYAAGDCATVRHRVTKEEAYIPLGTTANKQGRVAGENAAGGNASFEGVVGTGIAKVLDMEIARTGLSRMEIERAGIEHVETVIKSRTAAGYYPGSGYLHLKLSAEKGTGRLLGAQIVGARGSGKRIDVFAACLHLEATVADLQDMDLAYAPPFSPVYDAILVVLADLNKKVKMI